MKKQNTMIKDYEYIVLKPWSHTGESSVWYGLGDIKELDTYRKDGSLNEGDIILKIKGSKLEVARRHEISSTEKIT